MMRDCVVETDFTDLEGLPRKLRLMACVGPVVQVNLPCRAALVLARRLEAGSRVVVVERPPLLSPLRYGWGLMAGAFWLGAVAATGLIAVGL
ncbi:MAG: hypothetical protein Q8Q26_09645 [Pseudorhodobacter sp.]|nr:hypothetical protein [Pseudorhodobacter sp.]